MAANPGAPADHLDWPFFEPRHRALAAELDAWAPSAVGHAHDQDRAAVDDDCRAQVRALGQAGWLAHAVGGTAHGGAAEAIDTRAICLARETLARHDGLADFAFAMQGLGSGAISLAGSDEQKAATCRRWRAARRSPRSRCPSPTPAPTSPRCSARRAPTATTGCSTARRPGSPTAASPISTSCSRAPASQAPGAKRGRRASPPSSSTPARRASRSPSAST